MWMWGMDVLRQHHHEGIFGTPREPLFNTHPLCLTPELLEEWLIILAEQNANNIKAASINQGYFKTGRATEYLFSTCHKLGLAASAKYLALELFDGFMVQHIDELHKHVQSQCKGNKHQDWQAILNRVQKQLPLRVLSCCQLASKLTSHYKILTSKKVWDMLRNLGHKYSNDSILHSELRVLKTLDYRVMINTPLLFVEILLEILGRSDSQVEVAVYHDVCLKLLDLVYLRHQNIYSRLYQVATGRMVSSPRDRQKLVAVQSDYLLQAVAVVGASSYIINQNYTDKMVATLSRIARIPSEDILDFTTVIIQHVLQDG